MALTFRDFMLGIANSAPQISQMVYNYSILSNQQYFREEELAIKKEEAGARIKYYEAGALESETREKYTDAQMEQFKSTIGLGVKIKESELRHQQLLNDISQRKLDVETPEFLKRLNELKIDALQTEIDNGRDAISDRALQREIAFQDATLRKIKVESDILLTIHHSAANEPAQRAIGDWLKDNTDDKGNVDYGELTRWATSNVRLLSPGLAQSLSDFGGSMALLHGHYLGNIAARAGEQLRIILDPELGKVTRSAMEMSLKEAIQNQDMIYEQLIETAKSTDPTKTTMPMFEFYQTSLMDLWGQEKEYDRTPEKPYAGYGSSPSPRYEYEMSPWMKSIMGWGREQPILKKARGAIKRTGEVGEKVKETVGIISPIKKINLYDEKGMLP